MSTTVKIPGRLESVELDGYVTGARDIIDDALGKPQEVVNQERIEDISSVREDVQRSVAELDEEIAIVDQKVEDIEASIQFDQDGDLVTYDGSDFEDPTKRGKIPTIGAILDSADDEPTAGSKNLVESGGVQNELALGAVYDVSAKNPTAGPNNDGKWESLSALLSDANLNTLIPTAVRKGGMSIKFVQSSDNKYVQFRLTSDTFNTTVANWQGVDDEPIANSDNLVKSGGVFKGLESIKSGEYEDFSDSVAGVFEYSFVKDKRYRIVVFNLSGSYCNFSTRETPDGSTVDGPFETTPTNKEVIFTASANANYLRHNVAVSCRVYDYDGSVSANTGDIEILKNSVNENTSDITQLEGDVKEVIHGESSGEMLQDNTGSFTYNFIKDNYYRILRVAAGTGVNVVVSTRTDPDDATTMVDGPWTLGTNGDYVVFKASGNAGFLRHVGAVKVEVFLLGKSLDGLQESIKDIQEDLVDIKGTLPNKVDKVLGKGLIDSLFAEGISVVSNPEWGFAFINKNKKVLFGLNNDAGFFVNSLVGSVAEQIKENTSSLFKTQASVNNLINAKMALFRYDTTLLDVSNEMDGINMDAVDALGCKTFQDQIYAKIDSLVTDYPNWLEKIDLAEFADLAYPAYANLNGAASGDYLATPTYKTYMYKFHREDGVANTSPTNSRQKIFIVAGLHGWENASQLNTYILLSKLCKCANVDYINLAASCDFYIVPCANGYGAYHYQRVNANGVDLNRNFPTFNWQINESPGNINYGGPSAASEFETKLIVNAVKNIKPDFYIDNHAYGPTTYNFYASFTNDNEKRLIYGVMYDWIFRACTDYSEYFGNDFTPKPNDFEVNTTMNGTSKCWAYQKGVADSVVIEMCTGITGLYGTFSPAIVRLNELMMRLSLEKIVDFQLKNNIKTI